MEKKFNKVEGFVHFRMRMMHALMRFDDVVVQLNGCAKYETFVRNKPF